MSVPQQKLREIVFQLLFSFDLADPTHEDMESLIAKEVSVPKKVVRAAADRMRQILLRCDDIDSRMASVLKEYALSRVQRVEKNILRLGVYELFYDEAIPPKVAIAEAIRLTKKFSSAEAASFVNAVLDSLYKQQQGAEIDEKKVIESLDSMIKVEEEASNVISQDLEIHEDGDDDDISKE